MEPRRPVFFSTGLDVPSITAPSATPLPAGIAIPRIEQSGAAVLHISKIAGDQTEVMVF
jgi:hypothetical protein